MRQYFDITKTGSPNPIVSGSTLIYTIVVTNNGTAAAAATSVADTLPAALTLVDIDATGGTFACERYQRVPVRPRHARRRRLGDDLRWSGTVTGCANLSNTATASTTTTQSDSLDLSATATTTVCMPPRSTSRSWCRSTAGASGHLPGRRHGATGPTLLDGFDDPGLQVRGHEHRQQSP